MIEPHVLIAIFYQVPKKRERLKSVAIVADKVQTQQAKPDADPCTRPKASGTMPSYGNPPTCHTRICIQTFPDDWKFAGTLTSQYKQIGNAAPVNLTQDARSSVCPTTSRSSDLPLQKKKPEACPPPASSLALIPAVPSPWPIWHGLRQVRPVVWWPHPSPFPCPWGLRHPPGR